MIMAAPASLLVPADARSIPPRPQYEQAATYAVHVDLVTVPVTITGRRTDSATRFTKDDFVLHVDGRPHPIEQLAIGTTALSMAIAIDTSSSMRGERFDFARRAVEQLVEGMHATDEVAVYGFDDEPYLIVPWTNDRAAAVTSAMTRVAPRAAYGATSLYRSVNVALESLEASRGPRRALVVISDGNDEMKDDMRLTGSDRSVPINLSAQARLRAALDHVQHSDAVVYSVGVDSTARASGGGFARVRVQVPLDESALRALTDPTGGFTTVVESSSRIPAAAQRIVEALRDQYTIGFTPRQPSDGAFHRLSVTIPHCGCRVLARTGFWATTRRDR